MKKILLEKLLDNCKEQEYQKQYEYIINLLEEKKIKPVKASRLNGKSPALYREYWLLEETKDYSNFIEYEKKLERKKNWLINNLQVLQEHLEEMFHIDYSILSFEVEAVFFINTPTFYMFNGKYKALTLLRIKEYIENTWDYPIIKLEDKTNKRILKYSHPYFKNPIIISTE